MTVVLNEDRGASLRAALQCDAPACRCHKERGPVHCPSHPDEHPSFDVDEKDGRLLVICRAGCTQDAVLEALRARGLWQSGPTPVPKVLPAFFAVCRFLERHVVLPCEEAVTAVALWVLVAWTLDAFDTAPYLSILSPTMRAGKTKLFEALALLTPRPWMVVQPSAAVLFRKVSADTPTLLLDEAETIWSSKKGESAEALRALLNGGHRRGVMVPRCVGDGAKMAVVEFSTFCMKALAAIGMLPPTILDRSIVLHMKRATAAEVASVRVRRHRDAVAEAAPIREALAAWADAALPRLKEAPLPAVPSELDGRAQDLWEPLLAVAVECSDAVYAHGWKAAVVLSTGEAREEDSTRLLLLRDIHQVFVAQAIDRIGSAELVDALCLDDSSPWGDWAHGKRITPRALARLLQPFGIRPRVIRTGQTTPRGYHLEDLADAFSRYLAPSSPGSYVQHPQQFSQDAASSRFPDVQHGGGVALSENGANPHGDWIVAGVAHTNPAEGGVGPPGDTSSDHLFDPTPEDLAKGDGIGASFLRLGEDLDYAQTSCGPGWSIAPGRHGWAAFIRVSTSEVLRRAWEWMAEQHACDLLIAPHPTQEEVLTS